MTNPFPFTGGNILNASDLNAIGEWTDYTPTLSGFTATTVLARYAEVNELVFVMFTSDITAVTGSMTVSMPVAIGTGFGLGGDILGGIFAYDVSTANAQGGTIYRATSTTFGFWNVPNTGNGTFDATEPFTWASGDDFRFWAIYASA